VHLWTDDGGANGGAREDDGAGLLEVHRGRTTLGLAGKDMAGADVAGADVAGADAAETDADGGGAVGECRTRVVAGKLLGMAGSGHGHLRLQHRRS
jgi:hypothetical protein